jgi:hypothetical protein
MKLYKTELGQLAFKERSPLFLGRQRFAYILFDGKKTVQSVLEANAGLGISQSDVDYLMAQGFLAALPDDSPPAAAPVNHSAVSTDSAATVPRNEQQRYFDAKPIATALTASLGLRGFRMNLAVESAAGYQDLLKLLPKIQEAVGEKACRQLRRVLLDGPTQ